MILLHCTHYLQVRVLVFTVAHKLTFWIKKSVHSQKHFGAVHCCSIVYSAGQEPPNFHLSPQLHLSLLHHSTLRILKTQKQICQDLAKLISLEQGVLQLESSIVYLQSRFYMQLLDCSKGMTLRSSSNITLHHVEFNLIQFLMSTAQG